VDEKTDEQVANELEDNAVLLGQITLEQWRDVLKVDGRATVLEIAARSGWEAVTRYLDVIKGAHTGVILEPDLLVELRALLMAWNSP
jgi:hypothetical protein